MGNRHNSVKEPRRAVPGFYASICIEPRRGFGDCLDDAHGYALGMRFFFKSWKEIHVVCRNLSALRCPFCGTRGVLIGHGFVRGYTLFDRRGIRAKRVRCKRSPRRNGCRGTFSLRPSGSLPRRCFGSKALWRFIQALCEGRSITDAWEKSSIRLSLDVGYRLYERLNRCRSILRTRLCSRSPPPEKEKCAESALQQTFIHLQKAFGTDNPVSAYQEVFQQDFLALA